jgi:L-fuculose-phosphate aldolase
MNLPEHALRHAVIETALAMNALGVNQGTSGNVSVRLPALVEAAGAAPEFLITPTATRYESLTPERIVRMRGNTPARYEHNGAHPAGKPSSEWRFHHDIYQSRADVFAIVHTHSRHATALACQRRGIPPFHYMVAMAGGADIRCSGYATYGTDALSQQVLAALAGRKACLMANHGVVALGATLAGALDLAVEVENLAAMYLATCAAGEPTLLSEAQMAEVIEKFAGYKPG